MMKLICTLIVIISSFIATAQPVQAPKNIFIITIDGFRWQELFTGADSTLLHHSKFSVGTELLKEMYWDDAADDRKRKLMPFFWNVIASQGQLYGNRLLDNKVNMKNWYKISYPGYNELLTGYADWRFVPNLPKNNPNPNILEYLNQLPAYAGKVAAFSSWDIFPYILNESRAGFSVNSGYEALEPLIDSTHLLINRVQDMVVKKQNTRYDLLTFISAKEYMQAMHPRVLFLGLGEADEAAHKGMYGDYLQHANMADKMIGDLWFTIQHDPFYKDNTLLIITTDHGRGSGAATWHKHNLLTRGSGETWLAMMGPGILPSGEMKEAQQTYANQLFSTITVLMGQQLETSRRLGKPIELPAPESIEESSVMMNK